MKEDYFKDPEQQKGSQPVKVLRPRIEEWFRNIYPEFKEELQQAIDIQGLHEEINIIDREDKIASPAFVGSFKIINIQETYLSCLWCLTYSLMYIYDKTIHEPRTTPDLILSPDVTQKAKKAMELFKYGVSLLDTYNPWDIDNLPNPQYYDRNDDPYIEKANGAFLHAVNFVLVHELGHVVLGHIDNDTANAEQLTIISEETKIKDEIDADNYSFGKMFTAPQSLTNEHTTQVGLIAAMCSFLFFSATMKGTDHPDPDSRLQTMLEKLQLQPEDNLWGLSCLAFKLWAMEQGITLDWPGTVETYSELFYLTIAQLNKMKTT